MPKNKLTWGIIEIRNGRWSTNSSVSERLWDRWRDCWIENTNVLKKPIKSMAGERNFKSWVLSWSLLEDIYPSSRAAIEPDITGWFCSAHLQNIFGGTFISTGFFSGKGLSVTWDSPTHVESFLYVVIFSNLRLVFHHEKRSLIWKKRSSQFKVALVNELLLYVEYSLW